MFWVSITFRAPSNEYWTSKTPFNHYVGEGWYHTWRRGLDLDWLLIFLPWLFITEFIYLALISLISFMLWLECDVYLLWLRWGPWPRVYLEDTLNVIGEHIPCMWLDELSDSLLIGITFEPWSSSFVVWIRLPLNGLYGLGFDGLVLWWFDGWAIWMIWWDGLDFDTGLCLD